MKKELANAEKEFNREMKKAENEFNRELDNLINSL